MPKIKPLYDNVLVERIEASDTTAGGIVLPDSAKEKPTEGRVVAVGDGKLDKDGKHLSLSVSKGDRILFGSYAGTTIKEEGKEYLILGESEILAIVDDKPMPKTKSRKKAKK
jgi:chaperonin GroES